MNYLKLKFKYGSMLLFWPFFGLVFLFLERFRRVPYYYPMHCRLDDFIPFNEWFIIPYMFWFVFIIGMVSYTFFNDKPEFVRFMKYIIFTNTMALLIFIAFPTCQNLRPAVFQRDNVFTRFISRFYLFDTNTNVFPSLHVVDSLAVLTAALNIRRFKGTMWQVSFTTVALLICASTVFLKQHSILDVFLSIPVCYAGDLLIYGKPVQGRNKQRVRQI